MGVSAALYTAPLPAETLIPVGTDHSSANAGAQKCVIQRVKNNAGKERDSISGAKW
jgi:hypothetical protein